MVGSQEKDGRKGGQKSNSTCKVRLTFHLHQDMRTLAAYVLCCTVAFLPDLDFKLDINVTRRNASPPSA
jgi:hypothetical protein